MKAMSPEINDMGGNTYLTALLTPVPLEHVYLSSHHNSSPQTVMCVIYTWNQKFTYAI